MLEYAKNSGRKLRVLELGSGTGVWMRELALELGDAVELVGVDQGLAPS